MMPHPFIPFAERDDGQELLDQVVVDMGGPETMTADGALMTVLPDSIEVDFDPGMTEQATNAGFYANLAQGMGDAQLSQIAQDVDEMVRVDKDSRGPWLQRLAKGMELLGIVDEVGVDPPFEGASTAIHPLLCEAVVQFQARALAELFPPTGPAKGIVLGDSTKELEDQARRASDYQNYQLTVLDKSYYPESDKMLWAVGFGGSAFRKSYHDPILKRSVARLIPAQNFIVPYAATTLEDAPRYTHEISYSQVEMKRLQDSGFYLRADLGIPGALKTDDELTQAQDKAEGKSEVDLRDEDREHCVYEMVVDYKVPGVEGDEVLPYVISVERDALKVLAIRRGWRPSDPDRQRRIQVTHYPFIRGDGFYGLGLLHLAAGLSKAATGALRVLLDNAAWAALQGGFKSSDARLPTNVKMRPNLWVDTDMTADELAKAFYTPPYKDVPQALFLIIELLTNMGQRLVNTTESTVGDAKNTGPVGTTVALIEQGSKVQTAVHKRLHFALGEELQMLAELNGEHLPDGGYPYAVPGESRVVMREDFDDRIDVLPVSDPNIFSQTQRIALGQAQVQLAEAAPDLYNRREVHRRMLEALKAPDINAVLPEPRKIPRADPVTENALAIMGTPVRVFPDQVHDAHIAVHLGEMQMLTVQKSPSLETFQQIMVPHIGEHTAQSMRVKMQQGIGIPLPPINTDAEGNEPVVSELPPEVENMIAVRAAAVMQGLTQQLQEALNSANQNATVGAQEVQDEAIREQAFQREEARKDTKLANDIEREDAKAGISPVAVKTAQTYLQERGLENMIPPRRLAVVARELGQSFDETIRLLMALQSADQGMGPAAGVMSTFPRRR